MHDIMAVIKFRNRLGDLVYERFGQTEPPSYRAAIGVANLLAELLPADMLATFFRVALKAADEVAKPGRPVGWSFDGHFGRKLSQAFGGFDKHPGLREAQVVGRILPDLLAQEFAAFIRLAQSALEQTAALPTS
ncbi:hypothetical protein P3T36_006383 [Kitasatospora sp. MAP12-15]|uniref:hypothetical protein n=1 Tax=unclassified Kitasatospora TaxID=2633591 RepID=UPI0024761AA1|nr:hypothetical protein [Kitasatospora sp. MAP12-44]MDH6107924.1 hypothetical protein [Kitasatospora sp. MAP12-44]